MMLSKLADRYRYGAILLRQMVVTDFKLRYQGSVLGYSWSLIRPLALFAILYAVFVRLLKIGGDIPNFPMYLLLGVVLWNFFVEATGRGLASVVEKGDLLRKVNFPRYVVVLSHAFSALINLLLNLVVVVIFMLLVGVSFGSSLLWTPLILGELFVFTTAVAFILGALYVRYRDLSYIWDVGLQAAFYATPILYPLAIVPEQVGRVLLLNPLAQIIQDLRAVAVTDQTQTISDLYGGWQYRLLPLALVIGLSIWAVVSFRTRSRYFAEDV